MFDIARVWRPAAPSINAEARRNDLIRQYQQLHAQSLYGDGAARAARLLGSIQLEVERLGPIRTVLDYGCGRSPLVNWLAKLNDATPLRYDPAIPEHATLPEGPIDLIVSTDVLEHIPEDLLDNLLAEISSRSQNAYFHIATALATTVLPNGENAHCTVQKPGWWRSRLERHFATVRELPVDRKHRCAFATWKTA